MDQSLYCLRQVLVYRPGWPGTHRGRPLQSDLQIWALSACGCCIFRKVGYFVTRVCRRCYKNSNNPLTPFSDLLPNGGDQPQAPKEKGRQLTAELYPQPRCLLCFQILQIPDAKGRIPKWHKSHVLRQEGTGILDFDISYQLKSLFYLLQNT